MKKYNSIDDAVEVPEIEAKLPKDVKKEKNYNSFYSPLTNLGLATVLLFTGCVATPRVSAQDTKQSYGTEQTVVQDIDLSQYTKLEVEGTEGIEVYVSPIRRNVKDWDNVYEKEDVKKWIKYAYIWDTIIKNRNSEGISLNKLEIESLTGKKSKRVVESQEFLNFYLKFSSNQNQVYIPSNGFIKFEDEVYLTGDSNKLIELKYSGINDSYKPLKISFQLRIN